MVLSFEHGFEFFRDRILTRNDFEKLSHALISLNKFNLERAFNLEQPFKATFEYSKKCLLKPY
jgi:hypothetical protein